MSDGMTGRGAAPGVDVGGMNPARGLCEGCFRTVDEIAAWSRMNDRDKFAVLAQLDARRAAA